MDGTVIIADDDKNLRAVLTQSLTRAGAKVRATATLGTLWRWLEEGEGDVVLSDVNLMDGDAIEVLPKMRALRPDLQFVLMSAQNTVITAIRAEEAGAFEYLAKPFDLREMIETLNRAQAQVKKPISPAAREREFDLPLIGRSDVMQELYRKLSKIIASDLPVLILGETGTGKSLMADVIHRYGSRKGLSLVRYDGANYGEGSIASVFDEAGDGSLILEKLDDYLPSEQREILQAIEGKRYQARLIATASSGIEALVDEGQFRADLFHELNVLQIEAPPLREHIEDIEELAAVFIEEESGAQKQFSQEAVVALQGRHWPGNVKELQALIRRIVAMSSKDEIGVEDLLEFLPREDPLAAGVSAQEFSFSRTVENHIRRFLKIHGENIPPNGIYGEIIDQVDRPIIEVVLEMTGGNQIQTAQILGINRNTLRKKIKNLDISVTKGKKLM